MSEGVETYQVAPVWATCIVLVVGLICIAALAICAINNHADRAKAEAVTKAQRTTDWERIERHQRIATDIEVLGREVRFLRERMASTPVVRGEVVEP